MDNLEMVKVKGACLCILLKLILDIFFFSVWAVE